MLNLISPSVEEDLPSSASLYFAIDTLINISVRPRLSKKQLKPYLLTQDQRKVHEY